MKHERDAAAERMASLKMFYESILNHSPSQKYVFDAYGRLLFSSEPPKEGAIWWDPSSRESIFEVTPNDVSERAWNLIEHIRASVEKGQIVRSEDQSNSENGEPIQFLQSILPYRNASGRIEHIIVTGVDISELKKVQEAVNRKK